MNVRCIAIVIPNWNGKNLIKTCLKSIERNTTYPNFKIIVVDNGSQDGSVEMIRKEFPNVRLICNKENLGFPKACNQGIKEALRMKSDYVLLMNNDTEVTQEEWLKELVKVAEHNKMIGIIGCKILSPDGKQHIVLKVTPLGSKKIETNKVCELDIISGSAFLVKREVFKKIGLLDEGFSPFLCEDTDFFFRAKRAGYKIIYNPLVTIIHHEHTTLKRIEENLRFFISLRNEIRFSFLNLTLPRLIAVLALLILFTLLEKRNPAVRLTITNAKLRRDALRRTRLLIKALKTNFRNIHEILVKRRNRTAKITPMMKNL